MAKLSAHGSELHRYFSVKYSGIVAVMNDGVLMVKRIDGRWRVLARKKPEVSLEDWRDGRKKLYDGLFQWKKDTKSMPTLTTLQRWEADGVCKTPTGHMVEPDGVGPDGVPSWLRILGLI